MRKLLYTLAFYWLLCTPVFAAVPCSPLPVNIVNNTPADATQVMANFNFIAGTCLTNAAASGSNSDITSLSALTVPLSPSQGGTAAYIGTVPSTGTANAQVVANTTPASYSLINIGKVIFKAGFSNTGAMTLQVGGTAAIAVLRQTPLGLVPLAGFEVIVNNIVEVIYDTISGNYQLINNAVPFPVGTVFDTVSIAADPGFLLMNGQCIVSATFPALAAKLTQQSCASGSVQIPDGRGRVVAMPDSGGSTNLSTVCATQTVGASTCGAQNYALLQSDLPNVNPALNNVTSTVTDPGHVHVYNSPNTASANFATGISSAIAGSTPTALTANAQFPAPGGGTAGTGVTVATSGNVRINGNVTQTFAPLVQPTLFLNKQIKY